MILERRRRAECSHDRISRELLDCAARALDLRFHCVMEALEEGPHTLRVLVARKLGRADEVGEKDGGDLALVAGGCAGSRHARIVTC
jgi:hypothetical protein